MPAPSTVKTLPKDDREWLEKQLLERNFADYDGLTAALADRGLEISRSALGRFGKEFKDHCENIKRITDMAQILTAEIGDDANAIGDAALRSMQAQLLDALPSYDWDRLQSMEPGDLSLAISRLSRAGVNQKKWMTEVRTKAKAVAESVEKTTKKAGLSADAIATIKREILGIGK
jgi:hypothetical protein